MKTRKGKITRIIVTTAATAIAAGDMVIKRKRILGIFLLPDFCA